MSGWWDHRYYSRPKTRKAVGGIRIHVRQGEIAASWWGKRWIEALESFGWHTRLERGRRYARAGQVTEVRLEAGGASAAVQGSRAKPYAVRIGMQTIARKDWARLARSLAENAHLTARLLAGEMPPQIEATFKEIGSSLFPKSKKDLSTDCACPDWENPCKHIAAVHYVIAQELDRDPFVLFRMRGIGREELLTLVRSARRAPEIDADPDAWQAPVPEAAPTPLAAPAPASAPGLLLPLELEAFFSRRKDIPQGLGPSAEFLSRLPRPGGRIRELGAPPFWRGEVNFTQTLVSQFIRLRENVLGARNKE